MSDDDDIDIAILRQLAPLSAMKHVNLQALARKVQISTARHGQVLFKSGDSDRRSTWVLKGNIELRSDDGAVRYVRGGSPEGRNALAPKIPRQCTARAVEESEILVVDSETLDIMLTWDQTGSYEVAELQAELADQTGDWMTSLLQTKIFSRIPPANIQAIFMRMQSVSYRANEVVIQQGTEGDYFYAIVSGKCSVTRETPLNRQGLRLAELSVGDTFGEEALIAEAKRNATVTMLTDGTLMRLAKSDFRELMSDPMQQWRNYAEACELVSNGGKWLDVRLPSEFQNVAIPGALNFPLYFIRLKLNTLDKKLPYVVYCDTGRRSSAAAFILQEHGFDAYTLRGGINSAEADLRRPQ
jgi:CRP-like cAMP-binding protein/rhodanese-related sulfurtransferase